MIVTRIRQLTNGDNIRRLSDTRIQVRLFGRCSEREHRKRLQADGDKLRQRQVCTTTRSIHSFPKYDLCVQVNLACSLQVVVVVSL